MKKYTQTFFCEPYLKAEVFLRRLGQLHAVAELCHETPPYPGTPRHVQAGQSRAVHRDARNPGLRDRSASGEIKKVRVHAAEGSQSRVVHPLAAANVELGKVLQTRRKGGETVRVHLAVLLGVCEVSFVLLLQQDLR